MEENWRSERNVREKWEGKSRVSENGEGKGNVNENQIMLRQAGFVVLIIVIFLQYFKLAAYLSDRYFFASYFWSYFVLFLGIPFSYYAAKFLVRIIKRAL